MPITNNNQRGLLIVSYLETSNEQRYRNLYRFLESSGVFLAETCLEHLYGTIQILSNTNATTTGFVNALRDLANTINIREVDVILHLHGHPNKLVFADKIIKMNDLSDEINRLNVGNRLRMLYSTACFGSSHAPKFVNAGFTCASGARGINANSPIEYPVFLSSWAAGRRFKTCIEVAENYWGSIPLDAIAQLAFPSTEVDSNKDIFGRSITTIHSI